MKTILIIGGTGFLGKNLALRLKSNYRIVLAGRNHHRLLLAQKQTGCKTIPIDITNIETIREAYSINKPDIVIHAAAIKFIDLAEEFPNNCIDINILGTQNVMRASIEHKISYVIGISTDKATTPTKSMYGISKLIMEKLFCSANLKTITKFACVRLGNVSWSTGSVFHIWSEMLNNGNIIRSTGINMTRFICTIEMATSYVETVLKNENKCNGKVIVPIMKSIEIKKLLALFINIHGGQYIQIAPRLGERQHEYLVSEIEIPYSTYVNFNNDKYILIDNSSLSKKPISKYLSSKNADKYKIEQLKNIISKPFVL